MIESLQMELIDSIKTVALGIAAHVPSMLAALVFIIIGWIFGSAAGKVVAHLVSSLRIDDALAKAGVTEVVSRGGYKLDTGAFFGWLVKAFFMVVFTIAAFDVLGLSAVNEFLRVVVAYIPNVIAAALILLVASIAADLVGGVISGATGAMGASAAHLLGTVARWAIWVFAFIAALSHVGIAEQYMFTLFTGFVAMLAIAGGLAFGLGGKVAAEDFIRKSREEMKSGRKA